MKKTIFGLSLMLLFSLNVNALNITTESEFNSCITENENTCILQNDLELTSQKIIGDGKVIVLDLNGYEITYGGSATIKSGLIAVNHGGKLTINDSNTTGKINSGSKTYAAIAMTVTGDDDNTKVAELVINGGSIIGNYYAITGNGNTGRDNTKITINGGVIKGVYTDDNLGIYHPQNGIILINGGTISGITGIEIRAGKLVVNGGKIIGDYNSLIMSANGDGSTTKGAAIAVMQHNTSLKTELEVNGGTIEGYTAVAQKKVQASVDDSLVTITLNGGVYNALNDSDEVIYAQTKTAFIKGGIFNKMVNTSYLQNDYEIVKNNSKYVVSAIKTVETTITEGKVLFETNTTLDKSYTLIVTKKDTTKTSEVENKVNELLKNDKTKTDIKLISLYEIDIKDGSNEVVTMSNGSYKISIPIEENMKKFTNYKVVYVNTNDEISETLNAQLIDGKVVFNTTHLSTYGIVGYNEVNPNTVDNIFSDLLIGGISLVSLFGCLVILNKRMN